MMELDHLVIATEDLGEGAREIEDLLGLELAPGGVHERMGTHNRLLNLGTVYLEIIAINLAAAAPGRPRWYALDGFKAPTRLTHWAARCDMLSDAPPEAGEPQEFTRGDLRWRMAVPADGVLPFSGVHPALLQWEGVNHPCKTLPESGCRLKSLELRHPDAKGVEVALASLQGDWPEVTVVQGPVALVATLSTPQGDVQLPA
ncbi:MAG: VOC family protein [Pseudomonadota bacterium]